VNGETDGETGRKNCTGHRGNSGIGLATAQQFVKEGAFVFVTGLRSGDRVLELRREGITAGDQLPLLI
jgi:NAD(P)-dependent dehydrogenase (short-subunit alcohol dehydrogenase family)